MAATMNDGTLSNDLGLTVIETCHTRSVEARTVRFFAGKSRDPNKPALIIFTSGTTGKPKGSAMRRYSLLASALTQIWRNEINERFVIIQLLPTHHATGLLVNTVPTLVGGGTVEFTRPKFDVARTWERIRQGSIKSISAVPTIYVRLLQHWEDVLAHHHDREQYRSGMCGIEQFHCGSSALPRHVSARWSEVFPGTRMIERYGGTEFGNPFSNHRGSKTVLVNTASSRLNCCHLSNSDSGVGGRQEPSRGVLPRKRQRRRNLREISHDLLKVYDDTLDTILSGELSDCEKLDMCTTLRQLERLSLQKAFSERVTSLKNLMLTTSSRVASPWIVSYLLV